MKISLLAFACVTILAFGCQKTSTSNSLIGTWELVDASSTEEGKTVSTFDPKRKMLKIINATHFAFLNHHLGTSADSTATPFSAGGGKYTLTDNKYTEYLDYFGDKRWEGNKFDFTITLQNDTLIQQGVEKVEKAGVDHIIIEKYKRVN